VLCKQRFKITCLAGHRNGATTYPNHCTPTQPDVKYLQLAEWASQKPRALVAYEVQDGCALCSDTQHTPTPPPPPPAYKLLTPKILTTAAKQATGPTCFQKGFAVEDCSLWPYGYCCAHPLQLPDHYLAHTALSLTTGTAHTPQGERRREWARIRIPTDQQDAQSKLKGDIRRGVPDEYRYW
jgi:hypothetical protein